MNCKSALIIASAPEKDLSYVKNIAETLENPLVICADGGVLFAERLSIKPHIVVGDGDSSSVCNEPVTEVIRLKPEKDDSDLKVCVNIALERGCRNISIVCASGGRADHYLSNISLLEYIYEQGGSGSLIDSQNCIMFFRDGVISFENDKKYKYFSIIPLDKEIEGVNLKGLKYPLFNAVLNRSDIISLSNEPNSDVFSVSIRSGRTLLIFSNDR